MNFLVLIISPLKGTLKIRLKLEAEWQDKPQVNHTSSAGKHIYRENTSFREGKKTFIHVLHGHV